MSIIALWLPILVSAVAVFLAGAVIWMAMPWHKSDFRKTKDEEAVRVALGSHGPGYYMIPYCIDQKAFKQPEVQRKFVEGPLAYITVVPSGLPQMGPKLVLSFVYYLVVGILCAYLLSRTLGPEASFASIFRVTASVAFIAYGFAYVQESIWFGRPWPVTARNFLDALIYGLLTGATFGWLAA